MKFPALQVSLALVATAWGARLAQQEINKGLSQAADDYEEPDLVKRAVACSVPLEQGRRSCQPTYVNADFWAAGGTLFDDQAPDGERALDMQSYGGAATQNAGDVDLNLYRY